MINTELESNVAQMVISDLGFLYREYLDNSIIDILNSLVNTETGQTIVKATSLEVLSNIYSLSENFDKVNEVNQKLIDDFALTEHEKNARLNLFYSFYNQEQDSKALEVLSGISKEYAGNDEVVMAKWLIENKTGQEVVFSKTQGSEFSSQETIDPNTFSLAANYPNPFNPQTTISYSIPEISQVKVEIIDINGSIIKTFDEGIQEAGLFTLTWDGTNSNGVNVASGIYLYRITALSTESGKHFIDSKKMILLR